MPIIYKKGDLFSEKFDIIVNPINCTATSGKGLALEFKKRYPYNNNVLQACCINEKLDVGNVYLIYDTKNSQYIANITTKDDWQNPSRYEWVYSGLQSLRETIVDIYNKDGLVFSVAMSYIGCGLGGLSKEKVKPYIDKHLGDLPNKIVVFG